MGFKLLVKFLLCLVACRQAVGLAVKIAHSVAGATSAVDSVAPTGTPVSTAANSSNSIDPRAYNIGNGFLLSFPQPSQYGPHLHPEKAYGMMEDAIDQLRNKIRIMGDGPMGNRGFFHSEADYFVIVAPPMRSLNWSDLQNAFRGIIRLWQLFTEPRQLEFRVRDAATWNTVAIGQIDIQGPGFAAGPAANGTMVFANQTVNVASWTLPMPPLTSDEVY